MKCIPGKYLFEYWGNPDNYVLPLWGYIDANLDAQEIDEKYLIDLFDITPAALYKWKNTEGSNISKDKLVVLANMFGVTIDQLYEKDCNDDIHTEDIYGVSDYLNIKDYRQLTFHDLFSLFNIINEFVESFNYYPLGYFPLDEEDRKQGLEEDFWHIDDTMMEYLCPIIHVNVTYDTKDGNVHEIKSISYKELCDIGKKINEDWGKDALNHINAVEGEEYERIILLSENLEYLDYVLNKWKIDVNFYMKLWSEIKEEKVNFDKNYLVAKVLISRGGKVFANGVFDEEKTVELMMEIIKHDAKQELDSLQLKIQKEDN